MKSAMFVACGFLILTLQVHAGEPERSEPAKVRKWWVSGVALISEQKATSTVNWFTVGLYISTEPPDFVQKFTKESWELKDTMVFAPMDFWEKQTLPDGSTALQFRFMGAETDLPSALRKMAFRLKGEKEWIHFADFIKVTEDFKYYRVSQCLRCNSVLKLDADRCPRCGAVFPSEKAQVGPANAASPRR